MYAVLDGYCKCEFYSCITTIQRVTSYRYSRKLKLACKGYCVNYIIPILPNIQCSLKDEYTAIGCKKPFNMSLTARLIISVLAGLRSLRYLRMIKKEILYKYPYSFI